MPILAQTQTKDILMKKQAKDNIVIFPFMAKGHTIPLIHLATALSACSDIRITFITTPANAPFLRESLPIDRHPDVRLIILPFPDCPPLPSGCESTDTLPSFHLYPLFLGATSLLRQPFDAALAHLARSSPPLCLVSDFFLGWTLPICCRLNLPRIVFHGMSAFSMTLCKSLWLHLPALDLDVHSGAPFHVPGTPPGLRLTKSEIPDSVLKSTDPNDPGTQFLSEIGESDLNSWGVLVNSFAGLEGDYARLFESFYRNGARAWLVGPLCLLANSSISDENHEDECVRWLDEQETGSVVYVSFGTQAEVPDEQLDEAARGLAESGHKFLWAVRSSNWTPPDDVAIKEDRGKIVRWAPQTAVLNHRATSVLVSHCGWNSVMEAVSAGVPMLTWPMIAEQQLNAKLVVEELGVGLRLGTGGASGEVVKREVVREGVRELMGDGKKGRRARERAAELGEKARAAVGEGGSSHRRLGEMIEELRKCQRERSEDKEGEVVAVDAVQSESFVKEFRWLD